MTAGSVRVLTGLLEAGHLASMDQLPALVAEQAAHAGMTEILIYIADLQQTVLRLLPTPGEEPDEKIAEFGVDSTLAGRSFRETRTLSCADAEQTHWWVPLLNGTERFGVLRASAPLAIDVAPGDLRDLAALVSLLIVSKRSHSDIYARLIRTRPMNVAAEMQWNLMPPLNFANPQVVIGAALEPAYEVGGDAFDYALAGGSVHLGIFDAMGHDTAAGLTANLAVAACRNFRRQGADLVATSEGAERVLIEEFGPGTRYVTAILAELHLESGLLTWVNRGHHPPVLIRGGRWIGMLACPPSHPLAMDLGLPVTLCREQLEPGDRLLLYTDGIPEAGSPRGREFGLARFVEFVIRHNADGLPVAETLRRLIHNVLAYHDGQLEDDATVLVIEWRGRP
ncbi:hypothetical protein Acor_71820 [Acrocarpospora corrugata]|uniref:PPM-type phosphatase domain-containing protein n=2 Tax=Acrocarpospora corrugata TaxID=35763 RepID=A0A5M3W8D3_9ACTN|nr:hypothetical protein Acor_71820 [Acrocarpospora corrugata]